jgi:putative protease
MFVHGALCVSYSGQCFSSEAWGGRSANRGQCAQACRLPYDLIVDDAQLKPLGDARYLLSPGDLYALRQMPEIVQTSACHALKIEGRYKDADYVALTTAAYRQAVDEAWAGLPLSITPQSELQLEQVYSRGLGAHFVTGTNHQTVVNGRSPRHRGVLMGKVSGAGRPRLDHAGAWPPRLRRSSRATAWSSTRRTGAARKSGGGRARLSRDGAARRKLEVTFGNGANQLQPHPPRRPALALARPRPGQGGAPLYSTPPAPVHRQPLRVHVTAVEGAAAGDNVDAGRTASAPGHVVREPLDAATAARRRRRLPAPSSWGGWAARPMSWANLTAEVRDSPLRPASLLNQLRRQAVTQFQAQQEARARRRTRTAGGACEMKPVAAVRITNYAPEEKTPQVRQPPISNPRNLAIPQLPQSPPPRPHARPAQRRPRPAARQHHAGLPGFVRLRPAVEQVQAAGIEARVASPRMLKPDEQRIVNFLLRLECAILVRSGGLLNALQGQSAQPLHGDFSLNAANELSATPFLTWGWRDWTHARPERGADCGLGSGRWPRPPGSDRLPPPARLPHRALRLLPLSCPRAPATKIAAPVRNAQGGAARCTRPFPSRDGRRGLPQHRLWRRGAGGQRHLDAWRGGHPPLPAGVCPRKRRTGRQVILRSEKGCIR